MRLYSVLRFQIFLTVQLHLGSEMQWVTPCVCTLTLRGNIQPTSESSSSTTLTSFPTVNAFPRPQIKTSCLIKNANRQVLMGVNPQSFRLNTQEIDSYIVRYEHYSLMSSYCNAADRYPFGQHLLLMH